MNLVCEENTKTTKKRVYEDEKGKEIVCYYIIDENGIEKRTNISCWGIAKFREANNISYTLTTL